MILRLKTLLCRVTTALIFLTPLEGCLKTDRPLIDASNSDMPFPLQLKLTQSDDSKVSITFNADGKVYRSSDSTKSPDLFVIRASNHDFIAETCHEKLGEDNGSCRYFFFHWFGKTIIVNGLGDNLDCNDYPADIQKRWNITSISHDCTVPSLGALKGIAIYEGTVDRLESDDGETKRFMMSSPPDPAPIATPPPVASPPSVAPVTNEMNGNSMPPPPPAQASQNSASPPNSSVLRFVCSDGSADSYNIVLNMQALTVAGTYTFPLGERAFQAHSISVDSTKVSWKAMSWSGLSGYQLNLFELDRGTLKLTVGMVGGLPPDPYDCSLADNKF